jgi:hypothetical protein
MSAISSDPIGSAGVRVGRPSSKSAHGHAGRRRWSQRARDWLFGGKIPGWLKLAHTLFVIVVIVNYWRQYTPVNFLWFCNVALLTTCVALWLESRLLISMQAVAIVVWQLVWQLDFLVQLTTGVKTVGASDYMFDASVPLFVRGLSISHAWMPYLLLWLVARLGYDRRALLGQTIYGWLVLVLSYMLTTNLEGPAGNVNKIYGLVDSTPQTWIASWQWLLLLMAVVPLILYVPMHILLRRTFTAPTGKGRVSRA